MSTAYTHVAAAAQAPALLRVERLSIGFRIERNEVVRATRAVSFSVPREGVVALVGESGSGKSVTALAVMGLLPKDSAVIERDSAIYYNGVNVLFAPPSRVQALRGREIAMIFQEPMSALNPVIRVGEQIEEVLRAHLKMGGRQARTRAAELLHEVGIDEPQRRLASFPHELSGGQQQRVMIAMAIACEPKLLIADEPTTALDVTIQRQILELLQRVKVRHRMSILFITHDLALVKRYAEQVVVMHEGVVRESGSAQQIFGAPRDAYTRALLACRPRLDRRPLRLPVVEDFLGGAERGNGALRDAEREDNALRDAARGDNTLRDAERADNALRDAERARGVSADDASVLSVKHLSKRFFLRGALFSKQPLVAVNDVSFALPKGKTVGLVGESGSGKSTLGLALLRLRAADSGEVLFDGADISSLPAAQFHRYKRRMQIIFQNPYASLNPRFTVGQILLEPMQLHGIGADDSERLDMALALLRKVGLDEAAFGKHPHEFSGGQRQRIAIARCLTLRPEVIVCDECVSALDVSIQAQVLNLLQDLQDEYALSYLFISHDLAVVKHMSDYVLVMRAGEVVEQGEVDAVFAGPQHAYTRQLLATLQD